MHDFSDRMREAGARFSVQTPPIDEEKESAAFFAELDKVKEAISTPPSYEKIKERVSSVFK